MCIIQSQQRLDDSQGDVNLARDVDGLDQTRDVDRFDQNEIEKRGFLVKNPDKIILFPNMKKTFTCI